MLACTRSAAIRCVALAPMLAIAVACTDDPVRPNRLATKPGGAAAGINNPQPSPLGPPTSVGIQLVAEGLTSPVLVVPVNDGTGRLFIIDQIGLIRIVTRDGTLLPQPFLDIRSKIVPLSQTATDERGLLGLAFHPQYATNGRFFVYYSAPLRPGAPTGFNTTATFAEYRVSSDPNRADPGSERIFLQIDKPQANHNGGTIAFGPADGFLYISIGDGGGRDDVQLGHVDDWYAANPGGNGQDITQNLLGNILRIDVDHGSPYGIPSDNPFVDGPGLDEIWAYGFRNPYRCAFDPRPPHTLLCQDAGQELWEEVSVVVRRGNYGWNVKEGTSCFNARAAFHPLESCPDVDPTTGEPLRDPVIQFANSKNQDFPGLSFTVVGGNVYRGSRLPELAGHYIFGGATASFTAFDGRVFAATPTSGGLWPMQELLFDGQRLRRFVLGFGQDLAGEVYVETRETGAAVGTTGKVWRLGSPSPHGEDPVLTARLSPENEAPACTSGRASGTATIRFVGPTTIEFLVEIANPQQENFTAGHIHVGQPGVAGPIVVPLYSGADHSLNIRAQGQLTLTPDLADAIRSNPAAYYVNFHTTACPGGAARGQLTGP